MMDYALRSLGLPQDKARLVVQGLRVSAETTHWKKEPRIAARGHDWSWPSQQSRRGQLGRVASNGAKSSSWSRRESRDC
jgi:hypothetical protein